MKTKRIKACVVEALFRTSTRFCTECGLALDIHLRCPGTLFISHENANFLFSVFRVVQGEAKNTKNNGGVAGQIFAFLHALKIGTFRGK